MHELGHVQQRDGEGGSLIDSELEERCDADLPPAEVQANLFSQNFLIPQEELEKFIARTSPLFTPERIGMFSKRIGVHPGIVVGQLQKREELPWSHGNRMKVKVRHLVARAALSDGWGYAPPITAGS
jgi:HTH-type transcriptional regulator/antitoxin HigA